MSQIQEIRQRLREGGNATLAQNYKRYLKSDYSFYGCRVPALRKIAREYRNLDIYEAFNLFDELWTSGNHEEMNLGIFILQQYKKKFNLEFWQFLMKRIERAKSWDHIDIMCSGILGYILADNPGLIPQVKELAVSKNPWMRRASIIITSQLIRRSKIQLTLRLAEVLCFDDDIYVQKGAGWMLREAGKKFPRDVREFILMHLNMKPYAFSYAIEKMPELRKVRDEYVKKENSYFIIIRGPAAVGKTTIAKILGKKIRAKVFHFDKIMEELGLDYIPGDKDIPLVKYLKADEIMLPRFLEQLNAGKRIILDGNFYQKEHIQDLIDKLGKHYIFTLKASLEECLKRDKGRKSIGEKNVRDVFNLVNFDSGVVINTEGKTSDEIVDNILYCLNKVNLG